MQHLPYLIKYLEKLIETPGSYGESATNMN